MKLDTRTLQALFNRLFSPRKIEYLLLDGDLTILETSPLAKKFADTPGSVLPGMDVRRGFPELIGVEDTLMEVMAGRENNFNFKGIARGDNSSSPLYIDLYIASCEGQLIILVEDVTEMMVLHQSLVQQTNETEMFLTSLTNARDYNNKILISMGDPLLVTTTGGGNQNRQPSSPRFIWLLRRRIAPSPHFPNYCPGAV